MSAETPTSLPLDVVQRWFQAVITHPGGVEEGVESDEARRFVLLDRSELERLVTPSQRCSAVERLSIYGNAYYARLIECLEGTFPLLRRALGPDLFAGFAIDYIRHRPSRSYTLNHFGADLADYLEETRPPRAETDDPGPDWPDLLVDLARFDWAIDQVFDGPGWEGERPLAHDDLARLGEDFARARLRPVPCLRIHHCRFRVNDYCTAVLHAGEDEDVPLPGPGAQSVALTRRAYVVRRVPLEADEAGCLEALLAGATVEDALMAAAEHSEAPTEILAAKVRHWFQRWTQESFFLSLDC